MNRFFPTVTLFLSLFVLSARADVAPVRPDNSGIVERQSNQSRTTLIIDTERQTVRYLKQFSFGVRSGMNFFPGELGENLKRGVPLGIYFSYFHNQYLAAELGVNVVRHEARLPDNSSLVFDFNQLYSGLRFYPLQRTIYSFHPYLVGGLNYTFREYTVQSNQGEFDFNRDGVSVEAGVGAEYFLVANYLLFGAESRLSPYSSPEELKRFGAAGSSGLEMSLSANVQYLF